MDLRVRKNECCVIGLPQCGYAFNSMRSCFIGYGFNESPLEVRILSDILTKHAIEPIEAAGTFTPGQAAFCTKICSRIISSQFCAIFVNHGNDKGVLVPNANVHMEYGLAMGFNKYIIPFQKEEFSLSFNISGLDTIKYTDNNFPAKAEEAVSLAIRETSLQEGVVVGVDELIKGFLVSHRLIPASLLEDGERKLSAMAGNFGFELYDEFSGLKAALVGNLSNLSERKVKTQIASLVEALVARFGSFNERVELGFASLQNPKHLQILNNLSQSLYVVAIVSSKGVIEDVERWLVDIGLPLRVTLFCVADVKNSTECFA